MDQLEPNSVPDRTPPQRDTGQGDCVFTVDVEDWFHILELRSAPAPSQWTALPSRVERNFLKLLDIFEEFEVRSTCFFLGWVAERMPHLVKEAAQRGNEIASHGYAHNLVYSMNEREFLDDLRRSKALLEDVAGNEITGYRAPGFSATSRTPWFFEKLVEAGYRYDSSVFPAVRAHGGFPGFGLGPRVLRIQGKSLMEFPITVRNVFGKPVCFFGGGYLRISPFVLIEKMAKQVLKEGRPVIFYVHPREVDPDQPRLEMKFSRRFKSYVNLDGTEGKLRKLLARFQFITFEDYLKRSAEEAPRPSGDKREIRP